MNPSEFAGNLGKLSAYVTELETEVKRMHEVFRTIGHMTSPGNGWTKEQSDKRIQELLEVDTTKQSIHLYNLLRR